ncbi:hypothetical protein [Fodinibius sediminis]|uniref:Uncharacterized protein n=1 Tax=Fodinibius sediminis TaxID=1214077 RepID=A0A521B8R2_9BACT|nr:hypothetical protein [Fodinibius sediminis]SMO43110.1 hypothetical protein SAMN06265218_102270 [Fodinibius sediminis]
MTPFGGMEIITMLLIILSPWLIIVGYFLWLGTKISRIAKAQEEHSRYLEKIITLLSETGGGE